ncbi:hypothetical protein B0T26DRAFT_680876 [Lasiosphaeria miniovina]|uniref:Uncharacterized protein n=1 Tax=Lasiosphaeria miniovina TaxID=1954250 RepID=A0AA39ZSZ2_9PEZI|nr:uncharacterized protein B0T26DRAFT_680876 [Lasiosphaeria miniovina]KAK0703141.1 hypothetical protein B0T26DRAFT_680876 [Lasiosphaeria miniovina]
MSGRGVPALTTCLAPAVTPLPLKATTVATSILHYLAAFVPRPLLLIALTPTTACLVTPLPTPRPWRGRGRLWRPWRPFRSDRMDDMVRPLNPYSLLGIGRRLRRLASCIYLDAHNHHFLSLRHFDEGDWESCDLVG